MEKPEQFHGHNTHHRSPHLTTLFFYFVRSKPPRLCQEDAASQTDATLAANGASCDNSKGRKNPLKTDDTRAEDRVRKGHLTLYFLLTCLSVLVVYEVSGLESITKPLIVPPPNWYLASETPYPNAASEYDPEGAGLMQYIDQSDQDYVVVHYERASTITWTNATLASKAAEVLERDHTTEPIVDSGTIAIAGVPAGYAKAYDSQYDAYSLETVFTKGSVFFRAYANYAATHFAEAQITSLLNSIAVQESTTISCSVNVSSVETGDELTIYGAIFPSCPSVPVRINTQAPDGIKSSMVAFTDGTGNYSVAFTPNAAGVWTFQASWDGNDVYKGAESPIAYLTVEPSTGENSPPYYSLVIVAGIAGAAACLLLFLKRNGSQRSQRPRSHS